MPVLPSHSDDQDLLSRLNALKQSSITLTLETDEPTTTLSIPRTRSTPETDLSSRLRSLRDGAFAAGPPNLGLKAKNHHTTKNDTGVVAGPSKSDVAARELKAAASPPLRPERGILSLTDDLRPLIADVVSSPDHNTVPGENVDDAQIHELLTQARRMLLVAQGTQETQGERRKGGEGIPRPPQKVDSPSRRSIIKPPAPPPPESPPSQDPPEPGDSDPESDDSTASSASSSSARFNREQEEEEREQEEEAEAEAEADAILAQLLDDLELEHNGHGLLSPGAATAAAAKEEEEEQEQEGKEEDPSTQSMRNQMRAAAAAQAAGAEEEEEQQQQHITTTTTTTVSALLPDVPSIDPSGNAGRSGGSTKPHHTRRKKKGSASRDLEPEADLTTRLAALTTRMTALKNKGSLRGRETSNSNSRTDDDDDDDDGTTDSWGELPSVPTTAPVRGKSVDVAPSPVTAEGPKALQD